MFKTSSYQISTGEHGAIIIFVVLFTRRHHLDFLAIFPDAELLILVCLRIDPLSVLFTLEEIAFVFPPVWPTVDSEAVFLVSLIVALVDSAVRPLEESLSVHSIIAPCPLVSRAISPLEIALAFFEAVLVATFI